MTFRGFTARQSDELSFRASVQLALGTGTQVVMQSFLQLPSTKRWRMRSIVATLLFKA
jgi:hypothetical protein